MPETKEIAAQEFKRTQGTRVDETPPWLSYAASFKTPTDTELDLAVEEYSERRHESTSSQTIEAYHEQKEMSDDAAKQYQWVHPSEYADEGPRKGRIMHSSELINRLRKIGLKCWYRDHPQPRKLTLLVQKNGGLLPPEVGCWVQSGFMPEYTVMGFDDHGVPLAEKYRGWRTVLLQLILKGMIKEKIAHRTFGVAESPVAGRYNATLQTFRNQGNSL